MAEQEPEANVPVEPAESRPRKNEMSVLAPLLMIYTVAYMGLLISDFLLREAFTIPVGMMPVYMTLLGAYAADKEIRRWIGAPEPRRKGSVFVYLWLILFLIAFITNSFWPDFVIPLELKKMVLQVLGVFFGTKASKYIHDRTRVEDNDDNRQTVMNLIGKQGQVTTGDVMDALSLSRRSVGRLLASMADEGLIRLEGEGRGSHYVAM